MKKLFSFIFILFVIITSAYCTSEISFGPAMNLNFSTDSTNNTGIVYNQKLIVQWIYHDKGSYPIFMGLRYGYSDNYNEVLVLTGLRLLPKYFKFKMDVNFGGGLSKLGAEPFKHAVLFTGVSFVVLLEKAHIAFDIAYTDMQLGTKPASFLSLGILGGFYL